MRLVASFPLLFNTSGDVVCSKFGKVWETPLIFKVVRWMCGRWPKINKSPTFSNGVRASSFDSWTANLAQSLTMGTITNSQSFSFGNSNWTFCKVGSPSRPPKSPTFRCGHFWLGISFFMLLCFCEKNQKPVGYTRTPYSQTGKNTKWAETFVWCLLLIFKVVYQDHLTQLLPFTRNFVAKGLRLVWGQVGYGTLQNQNDEVMVYNVSRWK